MPQFIWNISSIVPTRHSISVLNPSRVYLIPSFIVNNRTTEEKISATSGTIHTMVQCIDSGFGRWGSDFLRYLSEVFNIQSYECKRFWMQMILYFMGFGNGSFRIQQPWSRTLWNEMLLYPNELGAESEWIQLLLEPKAFESKKLLESTLLGPKAMRSKSFGTCPITPRTKCYYIFTLLELKVSKWIQNHLELSPLGPKI